MTAESLFADLIHLGFRLEIRGNNIGIAPASRLTDSLRQAIKANKCELMDLLRTGKVTKGQPAKIEVCQVCGLLPPGHPYCPRCQKVHKARPDNLAPGLVMGANGAVFWSPIPIPAGAF
jgi:hypothetical protein